MNTTSIRELWHRGQAGWPAGSPIAQFPNVPLLVAIAAWIVGKLTTGPVHDSATAVGYVALACFAWWEVTDGANRGRRAMGAAVLLLVTIGLARKLGA